MSSDNLNSKYVVRSANWLPLPALAVNANPHSATVVDLNDFFPKGEVTRYYRHQGYGYIKDRQGREIYFNLNELDLIGARSDKDAISVGAKVGYDVSRASDGLHVRTLKIY